MSIVKRSLCGILMIMACLGGTVVCWASDNKEVTALVVVDKSKEPYGIELKNEVYTHLEKELKVIVAKENELQDVMKSNGFGDFGRAEKPELSNLAIKTGANLVLVVEIQPVKSDFTEILFYQAIKSEATLKVRLYDAITKQYVLTEDIASTGTNKTFIPYTFVGKKVTVVEAVRKAVFIVAQKVSGIIYQ